MKKIKPSKLVMLTIGLSFVFSLAALVFLSPPGFNKLFSALENLTYDLDLKVNYKPLKKEVPISILDIDEKSITSLGRWPWSRKTMALIHDKLIEMGAKVVAYDVIFSETEENIASKVLEEFKKESQSDLNASAIDKTVSQFDYDGVFAESLKKGTNVLGVVGTLDGKSKGNLGKAFLTLNPKLAEQIPVLEIHSFIGNLKQFQKAAKFSGFVNATPDPDGINRFAPLIIRYDNDLYPSLGLEGVKKFLGAQDQELIIEMYEDIPVIEAIKIGDIVIPTNPKGQILIPFRGPAFTFPYLSAVDVLNGTIDTKLVKDRLIFIGSSALALKDVVPTAIAPIYPGVEIHASVAAGILENYLPYKPAWGKGLVVFLILVIGILLSFLLPFLGPVSNALLSTGMIFGLYFSNQYLFSEYGLVVSMLLPGFVVVTLYGVETLFGYFLETRHEKQMRGLFNQYLPPEYIDKMLDVPDQDFFKGENKELTILFMDIRGFTTISEKMTAETLKQFLQMFLTVMTQALFENKATIDKYIGDAIMAFWGAPLDDELNAKHGIDGALLMIERLKGLNVSLKEKGMLEVNVGIGLNTGNVNVGDMGSSFRRSYTAIGDPVNLASRLEGLTKYYHVNIIVGESTHQKTKEYFLFRKLDKIKVKGKAQAIEIFQPICTIEKKTKEMEDELLEFSKALEAYFEGKWEEAKKAFEEISLIPGRNKGLCELYLERMSEPLPDDWDGSYKFEKK